MFFGNGPSCTRRQALLAVSLLEGDEKLIREEFFVFPLDFFFFFLGEERKVLLKQAFSKCCGCNSHNHIWPRFQKTLLS